MQKMTMEYFVATYMANCMKSAGLDNFDREYYNARIVANRLLSYGQLEGVPYGIQDNYRKL